MISVVILAICHRGTRRINKKNILYQFYYTKKHTSIRKLEKVKRVPITKILIEVGLNKGMNIGSMKEFFKQRLCGNIERKNRSLGVGLIFKYSIDYNI